MAQLAALDGKTFDYIVIGGGNAGCLIASRLAAQLPDTSILLLEAGPDDSADPDNLVPGLTKPKFMSEDGNWLYKTEPQTELGGREIIYPRGRGLGGCSANNFMAWVKGPKADWDDWAREVDDPWWAWDSVGAVLKKMETFDARCPAGMDRYARPTPGVHGDDGPIAVQFNTTWQSIIPFCLDACAQAGHPLNPDNNDGDCIGYSVAQFSVRNGVRVTSANAFLPGPVRAARSNLAIVTGALVSRVLFAKGGPNEPVGPPAPPGQPRAVGVQVLPMVAGPAASLQPASIFCRHEVVLTAGTFQSAQLLLLSGVGPAAHLAAVGIPLVADIPGVGQRIRDHNAFACEYVVRSDIPGHNQLLRSPLALAAAARQYYAHAGQAGGRGPAAVPAPEAGPLAVYGASAALVFPRLPAVLASPELDRAGHAVRRHIAGSPGRPTTEIWMHSGPLFYTGPADACPADASVLVIEGLNQNCQSEGTLTLRSKDPRAPPRLDPRYLSHPLDRRVAIETLRSILHLAATPALAAIIEKPLLAPAASGRPGSSAGQSVGDYDDDTLGLFLRDNLTQGFHSMGSCVMGRAADPRTVVTSDFRVVGLAGLRVADMSVCPLLTCNHTQVNAYLIGHRCSELLLADAARHGLRFRL